MDSATKNVDGAGHRLEQWTDAQAESTLRPGNPIVLIRITSFGPFLDVSLNPSEAVMRELLSTSGIASLTSGNGTPEARSGSSTSWIIGASEILDVSKRAVDAYVGAESAIPLTLKAMVGSGQAAYGKHIEAGEQSFVITHVLHLHLGVNAGSCEVRVETKAYNKMHFPSGDVDGFITLHEPINKALRCDVRVDSDGLELQVVEALEAMGDRATGSAAPLAVRDLRHRGCEVQRDMPCNPSWNIALSHDPGRYLCNYIFYQSLTCIRPAHAKAGMQRAGGSSNKRTATSLFIHVRSADDEAPKQQAATIRRFLDCLCSSLV